MASGFMQLPQAPDNITPAKFFTEWLPGQLAPFKALIGGLVGDLSASIATRVLGADGGEWTVSLAGGDVKVSSGIAKDALVTFVVDKKYFTEVVTGKRQDIMKPPPGAGQAAANPQAALEEAKQKMAAMRDIHGSVKFVIEDAAKPFEAMVKFAGDLKDEADCQLTVSLDTVKAMSSGETNPQAAFMSGQLQVSGDMTILMQLAPLMGG